MPGAKGDSIVLVGITGSLLKVILNGILSNVLTALCAMPIHRNVFRCLSRQNQSMTRQVSFFLTSLAGSPLSLLS